MKLKLDENNVVLLTDSYKPTHWKALLPGTKYVASYFESRTGAQFDETLLVGLQYILKRYLVGVKVTTEAIDEAELLLTAHFGHNKYFNRAGWEYIRDKCGGKLPLKIMAVREGTPVQTSNVLLTIVNTDENVPWLTNYVETILTHVWSASTTATLSRSVKKIFKHYLEQTSDNAGGIDFMLHDFGFRGVSSRESAAFQGMGHLVNFKGTDTLAAMIAAINYYGADLKSLAFSVAATEHSVMTQLGEEGEFKVVEHVLKQFPEGIVSVVGDSYHIFNHAKTLGTRFKDIILARNGVYVVRPDSGDPEETTLKLITILGDLFGYTYNSKSYKVLNPKVRIIWGDGIDKRGIENVLGILRINGWSAENMVFGMGGGLLQKINRDTQRFAFKSSAQYRDGVWVDVYKKPIDTTKASKRGFLKLTKNQQGIFETIRAGSFDDLENNYLVPVFLNGDLLLDQTFDQLRENAKV